ncbi:ankyrin repeat and SOCS box protein 3 isoform X2 [Clupea harengus]|uniref:Ankyrin repeat and SOCS box protein 3 isoform X2 n=1 Tax=Clupea harengus TaxID=7950 RepID=A0A6P8GJ36_CLUHA|nr:ankyrin repeat and SOCS box protein 3 isoform X2 [Clupea harengus]
MDFTECYQDTCSAVGLAARAGDARRVQRLLKRGYSADVKDNRGWNPLHEAAASGSTECVRLLTTSNSMDSCDYVNSLTHNSETPLYFAAKNGHVRSVKLLLKVAADVNLKTHDLSCPLFAAVDGGHQETVKVLIRHGAEVNGQRSVSGWSCLHQAVYRGHADIVRMLAGVSSLEAVDDYSITPLFLAAQYGHSQCVEMLAGAGANVNCQATDLATPLLIAAQEGHLACVEALLAHGANPNLYCNRDQWQLPIHAAAQFSHVRVLERLLEVTERECECSKGKVSPLYQAVLSERPASLAPLLRAGYNPDAQPCFGYTCPLELAMESSYTQSDEGVEIVRLFLGAGASISDQAHSLALRSFQLLQLVLSCRGLPPSGPERAALAGLALAEVDSASCWLPLLLRAGMEPALLLHPGLFEEAGEEVLSFFLEFVNWRDLPQEIQNILSRRQAVSSVTTMKPLEGIPPLAHLCRLQLRACVGSQRLAERSYVQRLPLPSLLHDYVQFSDVFRKHCNSIGILSVS